MLLCSVDMKAILMLLTVFAAVGAAPGVAADQDPLPRCGLGKAFHAGRRAQLVERAKEGVLVFRGLPETRGYHAFHQDKTFWYLTGVESPDAALVLDADSGRQVLFLREPNPWKEQWEGEMWDTGDAWVKQVTGFDEIRSIKDLPAVLDELVTDGRSLWTSFHPYIGLGDCFDRAFPADRARLKDPFDGRASREVTFRKRLEEKYEREVQDAAEILSEMRRVKTSQELDAMRRAGQAGAEGMTEAIRSTRPGLGEWELDALMSWLHRSKGAAGAAYHPIVGSGPNSLVLHYSASSRVMGAGDVVLIDYGPELDHYTTDITRTWPVDGSFTERQAELYDAVLAAQEAGMAAVKPGARMSDVHQACLRVLQERGLADLLPHSSCHYIGLEVHDVGAANKPLEPGVVFTIEPGLYEKATGIGIRIEDVVAVTADGYEVLSAGIPRTRDEIEAAIASEGVLDWMGER